MAANQRATSHPTPTAAPEGSTTVAFDAYAGEDLARLRINVTTMGDLLLTAADRDPDKLALVFPEKRYTYAELAAGAIRRARSLVAMGVKPRDHVGILMHTCPEFVELYFAIAMIGGVIVPINARYRSAEIGYVSRTATS
jgi:fatty-acyl-CoA synthase